MLSGRLCKVGCVPVCETEFLLERLGPFCEGYVARPAGSVEIHCLYAQVPPCLNRLPLCSNPLRVCLLRETHSCVLAIVHSVED